MALTIHSDARVLFIGDSITDCNWRKDPEQLGSGYVRLVRDHLAAAAAPAALPVILNRGISGNKVPDLERRWQRDVLDLRPDVLSVMIGINDVWHGLVEGREGVPIDRYASGYRDLLGQVRDHLPRCQLVLCEPTVINPPQHPAGNESLAPYVGAVQEMAREFGAAAVVPTHGAFLRAHEENPSVAWTTDGVHPTSAGHMLIARTWLQATGL